MPKYVAFLDILGFKEKLRKISQEQAKTLIGDFSGLLYHEWSGQGYNNDTNIQGFIVSDSVILHTSNDSRENLEKLLNYVISISRKAFKEQSLLLRGAIAKGSFEHMPAVSFNNLQKGLIVGQAYIDAYTLEASSKISAIQMTKEVYDDILNYFDEQTFDMVGPNGNTTDRYLVRWANLEYLFQDDNLQKLIKLAGESGWLAHYYNTLYSFIYRNGSDKVIDALFSRIFQILQSDVNVDWRQIDRFIENSFNSDVQYEYRTKFLRYLRQTVTMSIDKKPVED